MSPAASASSLTSAPSIQTETRMFSIAIAGSLPKPAGLAETEKTLAAVEEPGPRAAAAGQGQRRRALDQGAA
jgi:hypothetical protein